MFEPQGAGKMRPLAAAAVLTGLLSAGSLAWASPRAHSNSSSSGWTQDFTGTSLNTHFWVAANGQAPGYIPCDHIGYFDPSHVLVGGGYLTLVLTQSTGTVDTCTGFISDGAEIYTRKTYGYGTYQWTMRMSSTATTPGGTGAPVSGSVSAGFIYVNSETEIDFEFPGYEESAPDPSDTLYMVNWLNPSPSSAPTDSEETYSTFSGLNVASNFYTYKFVWQPGSITYYVNGTLQATHTTNVPSAPAHFMINHWGTDNPNWGGIATANVTRYFYIQSVSYTPLP
jgi:beta-glucanase (GH16 family)